MPESKESTAKESKTRTAKAAAAGKGAGAVADAAVLANTDPELVSGIICELPTYLL